MMRSMYSGISGLRVHQTKMDVIGNNIANVNTTGFKAGRVTFNEVFSQTIQGASSASENTGQGGRNPMQVGLGVNVASIDTLMTEGAAQRTDNPLDLKIEGDGFFIVGDNSGNMFTRDGAFRLDNQGNLVNSSGLKLQGWKVDEEDNTKIKRGQVQAINFSGSTESVSPAKTTNVRLEGNLYTKDADESGEEIPMNINFYDSQGNLYSMQMNMTYGGNNQWIAEPNVEAIDKDGDGVDEYFVPMSYNGEMYYAELDPSVFGNYVTESANYETEKGNYNNAVTDYNAAKATYDADPTAANETAMNNAKLAMDNQKVVMDNQKVVMDTAWNTALSQAELLDGGSLNSFSFQFNSNGEIDATAISKANILGENGGSITNLNLFKADSDGEFTNETISISTEIGPVEIDYSNFTQYASPTTAQAYRGDINGAGAGREAGNLTGINVGSDGKITGRYSNGETKLLGQVAIARFKNPAGLQKVGNNLYDVTPNSGDFDGIGEDPTAGGGSLNAGVLEMSNVDLSKEFTEMITTQRGFQASSRIITSSDEMLQELVNLKR